GKHANLLIPRHRLEKETVTLAAPLPRSVHDRRIDGRFIGSDNRMSTTLALPSGRTARGQGEAFGLGTAYEWRAMQRVHPAANRAHQCDRGMNRFRNDIGLSMSDNPLST